jgi:hypothetical protein
MRCLRQPRNWPILVTWAALAGADELHEATTELMEYLAFIAGVGKYPFKPSPEGEHKLQRVKAAL